VAGAGSDDLIARRPRPIRIVFHAITHAIRRRAMRIEHLIAQCPPFSRMVYYATGHSPEFYRTAAPGDAVHLMEVDENGPTGNRITALVIACDVAVRSMHSTVRALRPLEESD
jgi:hypothetical protein